MSETPQSHKAGIRSKSEEQVRNIKPEGISFLLSRTPHSGQFLAQNPSETDTMINKSDSDDALFLTDSSDEVLNDTVSDFSPPNESLIQTRQTIMESLTQSFVSVTLSNPNDQQEKAAEPANEKRKSNDSLPFDVEDQLSFQQDIRAIQCMAPMRRIPSDSAFPNFQQKLPANFQQESTEFPNHLFIEYSEAKEPSEEYVTVGSSSEIDDETSVSFFSQSPSTGYLHVLTKVRPHMRSKSASTVHRHTLPLREERRASSAHSAFADHSLVKGNWLRNNADESAQEAAQFHHGSEIAEITEKVDRPENADGHDRIKRGAKSKPTIPTFKATKLPRFYSSRKTKTNTESSKSESCVLPSMDASSHVTQGNRPTRKSVSPARHDFFMTRSTLREKSEKKDAGGVSYASKHLYQTAKEADTSRSSRESEKTRSPLLGSRSPIRANSSPSTSHARNKSPENRVKLSRSESSPPYVEVKVQDEENGENTCPLLRHPKPSPPNEGAHSDVLGNVISGQIKTNKDEIHDSKKRDPLKLDSKGAQKARPGSPMKILKQRSANVNGACENGYAETRKRPTSSNSVGKILVKRPSMPQPNSSLPVLSRPAQNDASQTSEGTIREPVSEATSAIDAAAGGYSSVTPTVMSLKVDVSVRAEDGSVHNFRDISPKRNSHSSELFAGVEEFIRNLLEGSGAIQKGNSGQGPSTTPVTVTSPRSGRNFGASPRPLTPEKHISLVSSTISSIIENQEQDNLTFKDRIESENFRSEKKAQPWASRLDAYEQHCQAAETSSVLTSTGSMISSDVFVPTARPKPLTTSKSRTIVQPKYTLARQTPSTASGSLHMRVSPGYEQYRNAEVFESLKENTFSNDKIPSTAQKHIHGMEYRPKMPYHERNKDAQACSPTGQQNSPGHSPERSVSRRSPRSRIPVPKRMLSSDSITSDRFKSRSPTPERRSFYQTAETTPERPRSVTPNSLCSADGSSASSVVRSLQGLGGGFRTTSPVRRLSPVSNQKSEDTRSRSASPRTAKSSPHGSSPTKDVETSRRAPMPKIQHSDGGNGKPQSPLAQKGFHSEESGFYTERQSERDESNRTVKTTRTCSSSGIPNSSSENTPTVASSSIESRKQSSLESINNHNVVNSSGIVTPIPAKRSIHGSSNSLQTEGRQHTVPIKRDNILDSPFGPDRPRASHSPTRPSSPRATQSPSRPSSPRATQSPTRPSSPCASHSPSRSTRPRALSPSPRANEEVPLMSSKTSFCSLNSPQRDRSKSPKTGSIFSPTRSRTSASSSRSVSPKSPSEKRGGTPVTDWLGTEQKSAVDLIRDELNAPQAECVADPSDSNDYIPSGMERELIETENTVRLMEETISVLERQNQSLVTNTREMSTKIGQEKSRRGDLKTAKYLLQRVRKELEKTTINSEEKRKELQNAKDRIAEQESALSILKESLREEGERNQRITGYLRKGMASSEIANSNFSLQNEIISDGHISSVVAEQGSTRDILAETESALRTERHARQEAEKKLAEEIVQKQRIIEAAKKWKEQLAVQTTQSVEPKNTSKIVAANDGESSNLKSYQSIHSTSNETQSIPITASKSKSTESCASQRFDIESVSGSECFFQPRKAAARDAECQCEIEEVYWRTRFEEEKQNHEMLSSKLSSLSLERTDLKGQLNIVKEKHKKTSEKKQRLETELKALIDKIHDMQREVQLFQRQSTDQILLAPTGDGTDYSELMEMEKMKLKEYYQQQVEAIVQEKVTEFQGKVSNLEKLVRTQINSYTKSMQQKFREKLATASQQQKEVISRLEVEHSKELQRLTGQYPEEVARLQSCLSQCRDQVTDKKNRLEQRETQVGTILRVVKLLIREGRAMKGGHADVKEQSLVEVARKILHCLDLDLDDIVSPRHRQPGKDMMRAESCVTFRSIPDSPRTDKNTSIPPVPAKRRTITTNSEVRREVTKKTSDHSTITLPFDVSTERNNSSIKAENGSVNKEQITYTRFGDEVLKARSEETLQRMLNSNNNRQAPTQSDLTFVFSESGTWTLDSQPPKAPPPTPPSVTTSTGTNTEEMDLKNKDSVQELANSVLQAMNQSPRIGKFVDKAAGVSASSLSSLLPHSFLEEPTSKACQCQRLRRALMAYKLLSRDPKRNTRSSSETSLHRLVTDITVAELISDRETNQTEMQGDAKAAASKASSESTQIFTKAMKKTLTKRAADTGGYFANPFAMNPMPSPRQTTGDKLASKPPIQRELSASPNRPSKGTLQAQTQNVSFSAGEMSQLDASRSRSRQEMSANSGFVERTISPSKNIPRRAVPTLQNMPSVDKFEIMDSKDSSEDSKFALKHPVLIKPRDNRASFQRKNVASAKKAASREHHSISPRERKLFTLRNQQHQQHQQQDRQIIKTEVTKRTLSPNQPLPKSPPPSQPMQASRPSESYAPMPFKTVYDARQQRRKGSSTANMDWDKYIKKGPWKDVYLHEDDTASRGYELPTRNENFLIQGEPINSDDQSMFSPTYSWAPPRRGNRDKWHSYLTTGETADQRALERFYATPERESASEARRRIRRSRKQAEVLEQINRLLNVSSTSDLVEAERRRSGHSRHHDHARGSGKRSRSYHRSARDGSWDITNQAGSPRPSMLDDVRRKALGRSTSTERHPMDPLSGMSRQPSVLDPQRVSASLDREYHVPNKDECSAAKRISNEVKNHMRMARDQKRYSKAREGSRDRSSSQHHLSRDSRRSSQPLILVSRSPRDDLGALEQPASPSRSRSRRGRPSQVVDMDTWVDSWERKWEHERKQRPLDHWPPT